VLDGPNAVRFNTLWEAGQYLLVQMVPTSPSTTIRLAGLDVV
jgi:hypothetical protein